MEFLRTIFQSFFEDTAITINFIKSHVRKTSYIEINTLFAIFSNKELGNFTIYIKGIVYLNEWMMVI